MRPRRRHDFTLAPRVLMLLSHSDPMTTTEIAQHLGMSQRDERNVVIWCVHNLVKRGQLRNVRDDGKRRPGRYTTVVDDHPRVRAERDPKWNFRWLLSAWQAGDARATQA